MPGTERLVRHLRLAAHSEADVRRVLPRLEDAMRCASLADDGARLRVVRKLALGRIAPDLSSQALSRAIEQQLAASPVQWVDGESASAEQSGFVQFASSFGACMALSLRLVRNEPCSAWYWPLAVPGFRADRTLHHNLRTIAAALARRPEARVALPAWAAHLVQAGAATALCAAISESEGRELAKYVGIAVPHEAAPHAAAENHVMPASTHRAATASISGESVDALWQNANGINAWLCALVAASGRAPLAPAAGLPRAARPSRAASLPLGSGEGRGASGQRDAHPPLTQNEEATPMPPGIGAAHSQSESATARDLEEKGRSEAPAPAQPAAPSGAAAGPSQGQCHVAVDAARSDYAGLLFVLPLLARLGLPQWAGEQAPQFARCVLAQLLRRMRAPSTEPACALLEEMTCEFKRTAAPASWADTSLAPQSAQRALSDELSAAADANAQALVWLRAARRWLRRSGGMGLASLVQRRGYISATPTHIDVHFSLNDVDMRVRRLGLDIDPGWLPWFGRVVSFHFVDSAVEGRA